jgi:hypothetical protein
MITSKKDVFNELLELGTVQLHVVKGGLGVAGIPEEIPGPFIALNYNLQYKAPPITDLRVDDDGVTATLSFNQMQHFTFVPWTSVMAISGEEPGIAVSYTTTKESVASFKPAAAKDPELPRLRLV